jgi:hypothetical protein
MVNFDRRSQRATTAIPLKPLQRPELSRLSHMSSAHSGLACEISDRSGNP